jgi:hypothetical protein
MRDRMPTPGPCACGNTDIRHHIHSTIKDAGHEATELRWCPQCGRATATSGRDDETYRQLRERADGEWAAAQVEHPPAGSPPQLDAIGPRARRVLAAICLLGSQRSATRGLAVATGLSPRQVVHALETLQAKGFIRRTRWSTPPNDDVVQPATWWPTLDWQSVLDLALCMAEVSKDLDTRLSHPYPATPQPEGATA